MVALSKALGLSRAAVSQWSTVPVGRLLDVERITGIPREQIRPDLFVRASSPDSANKKTEKDEVISP